MFHKFKGEICVFLGIRKLEITVLVKGVSHEWRPIRPTANKLSVSSFGASNFDTCLHPRKQGAQQDV